jgi:hypothetical protein
MTLPNLLRYVGADVKTTASSSTHAIVTSSNAAECTVVYEGQAPVGSALTTSTTPINYTAGTRTFDYASATTADVGIHPYTLKVHFAEYPTN